MVLAPVVSQNFNCGAALLISVIPLTFRCYDNITFVLCCCLGSINIFGSKSGIVRIADGSNPSYTPRLPSTKNLGEYT